MWYMAPSDERLTRQTLLDAVQVLDLVSQLLGIVDQVGPLGQLIPTQAPLVSLVIDCDVRAVGLTGPSEPARRGR